MDVEEQPSPNPTNVKCFGLKNSIQTNFGDDYVFQIVPKDDWSAMAVSLSTNAVKLYSPVAGQYYGECKGHSATINQISFSGPSNPHVLCSCSSDGTIRAWDTRTFQQVSSIIAGSSQEVFSFCLGGTSGNLVAAGCKSQILFWDWRNMKQIACLEDSHVDDVTQVHFVPNDQGKLISASEDGLICTFDTAGDINDDDHLESVINMGTSIAKVGIFGENYQKLWCLTHIETLGIWNWKDGRNEGNFSDARTLASESWNLDHVDYFIDCQYSREADKLWVIGGTNAGTMGYFPVNYEGVATIGAAEAILEGGHTSVIRSILPMSKFHSGPTNSPSQGIFGWTGGEDGRLCCWLSDDSSESNQSWISSTLVMKPERTRKKNRHHPY
ncbi:WD repeat-containing protein GTS1 [Cajanus cajan]|uniref:WD repeat-containing protein 89 isogeny n=1 Tax=Cajanus cajan TaxID=3821 RepID=A0A151S8C8_CAJCA|nr:WD repeat-containing protein GTS1 [Cajanus cajan]KYP51017.1 WD repeat-containing protein 89 isogeny [Cajanus cajan]